MCRDFISSADTILDMTTCCNGVVVNLKQIQVRLRAGHPAHNIGASLAVFALCCHDTCNCQMLSDMHIESNL